MRTLTKVLIALSSLLLVSSGAHAQTGTLAFGVLNQQSPALTAERWNPILHYTGTVSGVSLQLKMGRTVQETNAMMARGDFDFVFTNHNFQSEFDTIGFKVVARWAGEAIRAVIAVPADSRIRHLQDLEGKRVSFPSTDAFVAYAVPLVALKRRAFTSSRCSAATRRGRWPSSRPSEWKPPRSTRASSCSTPSASMCSSARSTCPKATPTWRSSRIPGSRPTPSSGCDARCSG